jgi:hypothetical protein
MKTWLTSWRRRNDADLEGELRASRPEPSAHFVRSIATRLNPRPAVRSRARLGFVGALAAATVVALAASGGFSYAASSIVSAAKVTAQVVHLSASPARFTGHPSAAAQYLGPPTITKLTASSGVVPVGAKPGSSVTVTGTNLGGITSMSVAGLAIDVSTIKNSSTNAVTFQVPSSAVSAVGPVVVTNPGGTASFGTFTVIVAPNITGLSVTSGTITTLEPGQTLTIHGSGFRGTDIKPGSVTIAGKPVKTFTVTGSGDDTIAATVPTGLSTTKTGPVLVKNAAGSSSFGTVEGAPGPTITSLGATSGVVGATLKITGSNFNVGTDSVTINGKSAAIVNSAPNTWTATTAFVTVPTPLDPNVTETGQVQITDSNGIGTAPKSFTTIVSPTISSFAPNPGTKVGGTITLTGLHLTGTSSVKFSSSAKVSAFKVVSDTTLTTIIPKDAASGDTIRVTNAANFADSGSVAVLAAPTIDLTGVTAPNPAKAGDTVTITGSGFVDTSTQHVQVFFGKVSADGTPSNAGNTLTVTVPVGAVTGTLKVVEAGGTATSKQRVTIAAAPTVASFMPTTAIADGNHSITIKGKGFNGTNSATPTVTFGTGGTGVVQPGNTDTQLIVKVPANAEIGPIKVTANTGTGTSKASFTPIKTPAPQTFWPSQGQKAGGTLTITGNHLSGSTLVTFQQNGSLTPFTAKPKVLSDHTITVVVPKGAASGSVTVTNAASTGSLAGFTLLVAPTISTASASGGVLTITGHNFVDTDDLSVTVKVGTAACTSVAITNSGQTITCNVPGSATGHKLTVTVTEEAGTAKATNVQF